jgi:hypothetical protein
MGLDIVCKDVSTGCGYSYIHNFRKFLIEATISYLKSLTFCDKFICESVFEKYYCQSPLDDKKDLDLEAEQEEYEKFEDEELKKRKDTLVDYLRSMITQKDIFISLIDYKMFTDTKPHFRSAIGVENTLQEMGIFGLKIFVDHSDCEGYFSSGQSLDILNWFARIGKHVKESSEYEKHKPLYQDLILIFKESVDKKAFVCFM